MESIRRFFDSIFNVDKKSIEELNDDQLIRRIGYNLKDAYLNLNTQKGLNAARREREVLDELLRRYPDNPSFLSVSASNYVYHFNSIYSYL